MKLGRMLLRYRQSKDLTIRALAKEIGVSFPTLCRIEHGHMADARTLIRILDWLTSPEVAL